MTILDRSTRILLNSLPNHSVYHEVEMPPMEGRLSWREPILSGQTAAKLYDATSFLTWQYGLHFNTHINIGFGMMGLSDRAAAAAMARFNKEMTRFLAVPDVGRQRRGGRRRCGTTHHYVYVLEYGRDRGLHAHLLCVIPPGMKAAAEAYIRQWWAREANLVPACARCRFPERPIPERPELKPYTKVARGVCPGLASVRGCGRYGVDTLGSKMPEEAVLVRHRPQVSPTKAHRRQIFWLQYLLKTTKPGAGLKDADGTPTAPGQILALKLRAAPAPSPGCEPRKICVVQLHGISKTLRSQAQRAAGFQSKLWPATFHEVYSGWEWDAYVARTRMAPPTA